MPGTAAAGGLRAATPQRTGPDRCIIDTVGVTPTGDHLWRSYDGTRVPTAWPPRTSMRDVFPDGAARLLSRTSVDQVDEQSFETYGWVVLGDVLHHFVYADTDDAVLEPGDPRLTRIGGGWSTMREMEVAEYAHRDVTTPRTTLYGLKADGSLHRWVRSGTTWRGHESFAGFASVKSMTLISMTATYDTFLMNTRGGALYTVRIPIASPMSPVVTVVRTGTWQGLETLIADVCGGNGTVLVGVDHDTGLAYLYAVGHAIGTSTVIRGLGRLPGTFPDKVSAPGVPSPRSDVEPPPFGE
ncbi:hypothetical protein N798_06240 [Knoellia flava TL1]|uniref:Uncharacterized protein n=1 Tax=Knoellia flava TL1 TaxID=1385518 RepID=A0ABR4XFP2_9MICO|nr:hypothetical protein [Knoellia flava]KGN33621.1 hypothetical protein N798_06240 [Knoellia flava TL1]